MKKTRVLVLFDTDGEPPVQQEWKKQLESSDEAEFDVARTLIERGHEVRLFGFRDGLDHLAAGLRAEPADVVFNLAERFRGSRRSTTRWPPCSRCSTCPTPARRPRG